MLSCSVSKHSCIPGAHQRKHLLIPCPTNTCQFPLTKARIGLERQRQTRTEYSIEQIRQSLQRLKIVKIVRMRNLHNFRTIDSVFFPTHVCDTSCQSLTHVYRKLIKVGHLSRCALTRSRSSKPPSRAREDRAFVPTYEQLFICRLNNLPHSNVSIVLRKLTIVNTASRKQEWTFVHSIVVHLIYKKFN